MKGERGGVHACVCLCILAHTYIKVSDRLFPICRAYVPSTLKMWMVPHSALHHAFPIHVPVPFCTDLMFLSILAKHLLCTVAVIFSLFIIFLIFFFLRISYMYTVKYDYDYSPFSSQSHLISHHMPLPKSIFISFFFLITQ